MRVYAAWWGGSSYSPPWITSLNGNGDDTDVEEFKSLAAARAEFDSRRHDSYYPCVDSEAIMDVWFYDPRFVADPYPDRRISIGPRGGVRVEVC